MEVKEVKPPSEYFGALPGFTDPAREYNERAFGDLNGREQKWEAAKDVLKEDALLAQEAVHERKHELANTIGKIRDWVKIRASSRHPAEQLQKTLAKFDESDLGVITWYEFERGMREVGVTVKQGDLVALRSALDSRQGGELAHKPFSHIADDRKTIDIHSIRKAQASSDAARNIARHIRGHDTPSEGYKELWLTRHKGSADVDESEVARADRLLASRSNEPRHTLLGNANTVAESMRKRDSEREHAASLLRQLVADNREQAHEAFAKFDEHGDGFVSWKEFVKEIKEQGKSVSKADLYAIVRELDPSAAGAFQIQELLDFIAKPSTSAMDKEYETLHKTRAAKMAEEGKTREGHFRGVP